MEIEFKVCDHSFVAGALTEAFLSFKVSSEGTSGLHGDGLAIWLTKDRAELGPVFGSIGEHQ